MLLFNEIWQIRDFEQLQLPEFTLANTNQRQLRKGGGSLIFIRNNIKYEKFEAPFTEGLIETTAIIIKNIVIASIYRPPSGNKSEFTDQLTSWIERLGNKSVYIAGDFNINLLNEEIQYFNNIEHLTGLSANIREVTRITSQTCIDNILTNITGEHSVSKLCIADHQGLISKLQVAKIKQEKQKFVYREMKESNWQTFSVEIAKLKIRGISINEKWNNISNDVKKAVEKSFPEKTSNIKYTFQMSRGLLKSKNKKKQITTSIQKRYNT